MFNFLGNLASLIGLVFSILAFVFAKRASAAAREARDTALRQSLGESMNDAARAAGEVVVYVNAGKNEAAHLRVGDLMNQISYFRGRWQDRLSKKSTDNLSRVRAVAHDASVVECGQAHDTGG